MIYENLKEGIFIKRPNRFIAYVEIDGITETCHVKNTGRCKELLVEGAKVIVREVNLPLRKTRFDLVAVRKGERLVNIDSQAPNVVFKEWLLTSGFFPDLVAVKTEKKYRNSRFDYYLETKNNKIFVEVKGVTLEENGIAKFPDAPTLRGVKHLKELSECIDDGYMAMVVFIIQMGGVKSFEPNDKMHPEFGNALRELSEKGAKIIAIDCHVTENSITYDGYVAVDLGIPQNI